MKIEELKAMGIDEITAKKIIALEEKEARERAGVDLINEKQFINIPGVLERRIITGEKINAKIIIRDGATDIFVDGKKVEYVSSLRFLHDMNGSGMPCLIYTAEKY